MRVGRSLPVLLEDSRRQLLEAIQAFRNDEVAALLQANPGLLDHPFDPLDSPLMLAAAAGNDAALRLMCSSVADRPDVAQSQSPAQPPSEARLLRVLLVLDAWNPSEKTWLLTHRRQSDHISELRSAVNYARSQEPRRFDVPGQSPGEGNQFPPSHVRLLQVAAGLAEWTELEKKWLDANPKFRQYEENLRTALRQHSGEPEETPAERRKRALKDRGQEPPSRN